MTDVPTLTLSYLEGKPRSAAQVLESLDPADAAALLEGVPARIAALVLGQMPALPGAARLALMSPTAAAGILRDLPYQHATGMLRSFDTAQVEATLGQLPVRLREDFRRSLRYPAGSVGAWMSHRVAALPGERTAAEALTYARQHAGDVACHLFVVDEANRLEGAVGLSSLLGAEPSSPISAMARREFAALPSSATLGSVASRPEWDEFPVMPVTGRGRKLVGSLTRPMLLRGLDADRRPRPAADGESMLARLASAYFLTIAGMLALAAGAEPTATIDRESTRARERR